MSIYRQSILVIMVLLMGMLVACAGDSLSNLLDNLTQERDFITFNEDWTPIEREFDGVVMVLVPMGCFMMGEDTLSGYTDYDPRHEQCFDTPFWIDKYEVTNKQFRDFGGVASRDSNWTEDDVPRESITWFEARDFCQLRGGRLPTEREWEYAARGPSNLIYPWGNDFVPDNTVYYVNASSRTVSVGSRPAGASWVGAMDMNGNVWEWVSSLYVSYPYNENSENNNTTRYAVYRGGSWVRNSTSSTYRGWTYLSQKKFDVGIRCARSYNP